MWTRWYNSEKLDWWVWMTTLNSSINLWGTLITLGKFYWVILVQLQCSEYKKISLWILRRLYFKGTGSDKFRGKERVRLLREKGNFAERISMGEWECRGGIGSRERKKGRWCQGQSLTIQSWGRETKGTWRQNLRLQESFYIYCLSASANLKRFFWKEAIIRSWQCLEASKYQSTNQKRHFILLSCENFWAIITKLGFKEIKLMTIDTL